MVYYVLETWQNNRYREVGRWTDRERASIMFHKPYWRRSTRRLQRVQITTDLQAKGKPEWSI